MGLAISFSGLVFRAGEEASAAVARLVPRERLLVETDAPFLSPPGAPRKRNEPEWVRVTAAWLAEQRGESPDVVGMASWPPTTSCWGGAELTVRIAVASTPLTATLEEAVPAAIAAIEEAGRLGAAIVCLPETAIPGHRVQVGPVPTCRRLPDAAPRWPTRPARLPWSSSGRSGSSFRERSCRS